MEDRSEALSAWSSRRANALREGPGRAVPLSEAGLEVK